MNGRLVYLGAFLLLAGCVAPEEKAPAPRVAQPAATTPAPNRANLEDAPIPNRRARGPSDSIISIQR